MKIQNGLSAERQPYLTLGEVVAGPTLVFTHANGYPPLAYRAFLEPLARSHQVIAMPLRPLWEPAPDSATLKRWHDFAADLIALVESLPGPVVHVGHSIGAVTGLLAAARKPSLFSQLIAIEPVLIMPRFLLPLKILSRFAPHRMPLVAGTLRRRDRWVSQEQAFEHLRTKRVFGRITDAVLRDHVDAATVRQADGSASLRYSKEWEVQCYRRIPGVWRQVAQCRVPSLYVRGAESDTLSPEAWSRTRRLAQVSDFVEVPGTGHLLPLEQPEALASLILRRLETGES